MCKLAGMFPRHARSVIEESLKIEPAVALLGPRQVGKTTLALEIGRTLDAIYLDLESPLDRLQLDDPTWLFNRYKGRLIILDEIHRAPGLFPILRGVIDQGRREGLTAGRFLILGSASVDLLRQSGETLAGRIAYIDLSGLHLQEVSGEIPQDVLWLRGGLPGSLLAITEAASLKWRMDFIRTYVERVISTFDFRVPANTIETLWAMVAHRHGTMLNQAELARSMGISNHAIARYIDLLVGMFLLRKLPAFHANVGKRLIRTPKLYVRDTGLLHCLLRLSSLDALAHHPMLGVSFEGFVIEQILSILPWPACGYYYRTRAGAEIDLIISWSPSEHWAIEIKRSASKANRGFYEACEDLGIEKRFLVHAQDDCFSRPNGVEVVNLATMLKFVIAKET